MKLSVVTAACILMALAINAYAGEAREQKTASGIVITTMKEGSGGSPTPADVVRVHYRGTMTDGREFDSSYKRGPAATFPLNRVVRC